VVGHLPEPYFIGAVAIGAMLFNYIYHLFNCLRMGTTAPTAQARGAEDYAEVRAMVGRALLLAAVIGSAVVVLQLPIIELAFWLIEGSAEVELYARQGDVSDAKRLGTALVGDLERFRFQGGEVAPAFGEQVAARDKLRPRPFRRRLELPPTGQLGPQ
jgi:hypothetical protein